MRRYPLYIFDLDGTLYRGEEAIPFAVETVQRLREDGATIRYVTNNSSKTQAEFADKLARLGFEARPQEVYTSSIGAAQLAIEKGHRSAFVVGEPGLVETLSKVGLEISGPSEQADCVIAGICWKFTYDWLNQALQQLLGGAMLIATNRDATYPIEGGRVQPGAGAIVSAIETAAGTEAESVGKPDPYMVNSILQETGVAASDALVVGDRFETDIVSGQRAGCDTLLVLTGVSESAPDGQLPVRDLRALL